jgi:hypothetical protein
VRLLRDAFVASGIFSTPSQYELNIQALQIAAGAEPGSAAGMEIPKAQILDLLRQQGADDQVDQAQQELPEKVDTDRDAGLLEKFGLSPQDLIGRLGGGGIPGL